MLIGETPLDLTHKIYEATRVTATMKEMENFCNRYVKTLRLKVRNTEITKKDGCAVLFVIWRTLNPVGS